MRPFSPAALAAALALLALSGCGAAPGGGLPDATPCTQAIGPVAGCDPGIGRRVGTDDD